MFFFAKVIFFLMIGTKIIFWYEQNKRDLPWRDTGNPYKIWVSEIILQQTRVNQGMAYYFRFIENFPDIFSLAHANPDDVLKIWQGLGYYSRARNMHAAANYIVDALHGTFPSSYRELLHIKGIGDYTAAAIASFAFGEAVPVIDGNVNRVISRLYGIRTPIDSNEGKKLVRSHAEKTMLRTSPGTYNQAIMEFGALQCVPHGPDCENCIFKTLCVAYAKDLVATLPVKSKSPELKTRYFHYLVVNTSDGAYLQCRPEGDIWTGLYEFPMIETDTETDVAGLSASALWKGWFGSHKPQIRSVSPEITHRLTHRILKIRFYEIVADKPMFLQGQIKVSWAEAQRYAVPKIMADYLKKIDYLNFEL
jgi:A/G-specific adenine glycosylase